MRLGKIVYYCLTHGDATHITGRRNQEGITPGTYNAVHAGDVYPAIIVRKWSGDTANLTVFLDGGDTYWATSRKYAGHEEQQGMWMFDIPRTEVTPPEGMVN